MEFIAQFSSPTEISADWLIVGVWEKEPLDAPVAKLDKALGGLISGLIEAEDISGKSNEITPLLNCAGTSARRVLLLGLGEKSKATAGSLVTAAASAGRHFSGKEVDTVAVVLAEPQDSIQWRDIVSAFTVGIHQGCEGPGLRKSKADRFVPKTLQIVARPDAPKEEIQTALTAAAINARAVSLTRELVNIPPCDLYPETFAERAQKVAAETGMECTVFDEKRLAEEKMGSLLGVAQGSARPPRLAVLRYAGRSGGRTLGLVGKGVTFDSGGLSLKPSDSMLDMKCDMAGAATVLGAMQAIAQLKLPVNVVGVLALVENMPSGTALKLGDVVRARNGKTIEIHNTDAEGRLILADALSYAVDQRVDHLVDLATLTGACVVALGTEVVGVMSNNDDWSKNVQDAAARAGELVWPLPMFPLFEEMIKSKVADMKNTGGSRWGGAITAAKLLQEFVDDVPWVHLDIAGPAFAEDDSAKRAAGGTGVMVRTLVELAREYK